MTLQIKVSKGSIVNKDQDLLVTMNLKCWDEDDDMETDDPVIDENVESLMRADNITVLQEQVASVVLQIQKKMQYIINAYKIKNNLLAGELLDAQVAIIESKLKG